MENLSNLENITETINNQYGTFHNLDTNNNYGYKGCGSYVATIKHNKIWLLVNYTYEVDAPVSECIEESKHYGLDTTEEEKALKLLKRKDTFLINASCYQLFKHKNKLRVFREA